MASDMMAFVKFSDGSIASLLAEGATVKTATELQTGGVGLNQVSGVSVGQAYEGKVAVAATVICIKDGTSTAPSSGDGLCYAYFLGPDGKIMCNVQGGGGSTSGMEALYKPVRMATGVKFFAAYQAATDGVSLASLAVCCTDGTCDVFTATAVDGTKTPMKNKDESTIGQALSNKVIAQAYATYNSTKGLNEDGAGVGAFFLEAADGTLKHMFPPCQGNGQDPVPFIPGYNTRILQNDTLSVTGTT
jgi:hypothetical protein